MELLEWWNLVFVVPFVAALVFLLLQTLGVVHIESGADADVDADVEAEPGVEHLSRSLPGASLLGFGKAPISIIAVSLCLIWGFVGWASNRVLPPVLSMGVALVSALVLTRLLSMGLSKMMPATESYATKPEELVGRPAETLYPVTNSFGRARVRDSHGNLQDVSCYVEADKPEFAAGEQVILLYYDAGRKAYLVGPDELSGI